MLEAYLKGYTTALQRHFRLHYFDAFAGTGRYTARDGVEREGSASIALRYPFDSYTLVEQDPARYGRLNRMVDAQATPSQRWALVKGDANAETQAFCERLDPRRDRAVVFLDPFGMDVDWQTLQAIRHTQAIDAWYLFPLSGVARQMARYPSRRDASKDEALNRVYGTTSWQDELYSPPESALIPDLQGEPERQSLDAVRAWTQQHLETLFPTVRLAAELRRGARGNRFGGPRLFDLYFLMSNPGQKASDLAEKLVTGVATAVNRQRLRSPR